MSSCAQLTALANTRIRDFNKDFAFTWFRHRIVIDEGYVAALFGNCSCELRLGY